MVLRIEGNGNFFPEKKPIETKTTDKSVNFDFAKELKKFSPVDIQKFMKDLIKQSEFTDGKGNLKPGVSPKVALNPDGTLKKGWFVDDNGMPHYSIFARISHYSGFETDLPTDRDSRFFITDPPTDRDSSFFNVKVEKTYKLQDGKLVENSLYW